MTQHGAEGPFPLGFADVREIATSDEMGPQRAPIGFALPDQQFVTELSFRRTAPIAGAHVQSPGPEESSGSLGVGHASGWRPAPRPQDVGASEGQESDVSPVPVAEAPSEGPRAEESVPFYKREITLRRKKGATLESAPVVAADEVVSDDDDVSDRGDQSERPIGFAAPTDDDAPEGAESADGSDEVAGVESGSAVDEPDGLGDEAEIVEIPEAEPETIVLADGSDEPTIVDAEIEEIAVVGGHVDEDSVAAGAAVEPNEVLEHHDVALENERDAVEADDQAVSGADLAEAAVIESPTAKRRSIRARRASTPPSAKESGAKSARGGRKVVGLKIGASQLAAAVVTRSAGSDQLVALARTPLEPGIVVDGEVRDAQALQEALQAFFDEHKLPRRDVRIGVASNRIGVRTVDISGIDDQERFDNAVRFKAHEVLPVSFSESVLDYRVVEERATENGDVTKRVLLVVAPKDQVVPFVTACSGAGIKLAGIDLEALGLLRAFVVPQPPASRLSTDTATVVVAIGHESTTLLVSGGGTCEFTRVFDWGGLALQQSIAQELDIHATEATTILHGLSLTGPGRADLDESMRARALDAVRTRLTPFTRELVSSLQFYQAQSNSLGIGEIVITGGTSRLEGLADALNQMIGVSVRVGDPLQRLSVAHPIDPSLESVMGSFAVPVGLAIEDDAARGVNLLPEDLRRQKRKRPSALQIALPVAAAVPLLALGFMFVQASGDVSQQQSDLSAVQAQIDALPEPTRPQIDASMAVEQQQRAAALASVLGGRLAWDRVLGDLSRVMPANVWLTRFSAHTAQPGALPTAAAVSGQPVGATVPQTPTGVTIEGYTYSVPDVAKVLSRLSTVPSLTNVVLGTTEEREMGKKTAIAFTILADIDGNGGAQ